VTAVGPAQDGTSRPGQRHHQIGEDRAVTPESIAAANRQVFRHVMLAALQAEGYSRERAESVLFWCWLAVQLGEAPR
jgi:hypothetical protein